MELTTDNLKLEEELERTMNSDSDITFKTTKIKEILHKIVITEAMITKFTGMASNNDEKK